MGPGAGHDAAAEVSEDRSADSHHRAKSVGVHGGKLSLRGALSVGRCAASGPALTSLKKGGGRGCKSYPPGEVCAFPPASPCRSGVGAVYGVVGVFDFGFEPSLFCGIRRI